MDDIVLAKPSHLADRPYVLSPLNATRTVLPDHEHVDSGGHAAPPRRHRVLIYGAGIGAHAARSFLQDIETEVWALNLIPPIDSQGQLRCDYWFDLHERVAQTADDLRWIGKCPVPIWVPADLMDAGPNCVRFPLAELEEEFHTSYWSCSFAMQIAFAMHLGFSEVALYGVELSLGTRRERTVEWACTSWWLGFATARGVKISVPERSWLGKHPARYGFEYQREIDAVNLYTDGLRAWEREEDAAKQKPASVGG